MSEGFEADGAAAIRYHDRELSEIRAVTDVKSRQRAIPVLPEEIAAVDLVVPPAYIDALPEHLALPLTWARYHRLSIVLTTTVEKLLSVANAEMDYAVAAGGTKGLTEDLDIPAALWCRTVVYVFSRLGRKPGADRASSLRSRFWTMKVFVDGYGRDWSADAFVRALEIETGELN